MRTQILRLTDPDRCPAAVSFDSPSRERALYRRILEVGIRTQLPEDERRLIELCCREGYTVGEAARLLRVDRSTAFRRLCRAKENLRRFAGGCLAVTAPERARPSKPEKPLSSPEKPFSGTDKSLSESEKQLSGTESSCLFPADRVY